MLKTLTEKTTGKAIELLIKRKPNGDKNICEECKDVARKEGHAWRA